MGKYKNRNEVPVEYKWDLSFLLENKSLEEQIEQLITWEKELIVTKDSKYNSKEAFIADLKKEDRVKILANKILNYLMNWRHENITNAKPNEMIEKFQYQMYELEIAKGPEIPRIFANEAKIKSYLADPELKNYVNYYQEIFRTKPHQLPKQLQEFQNKASRGLINTSEPFSILTDAELVFKDAIDSKENTHIVNHSTLIDLKKSKDAKLRKTATLNYRQGYLNVKQTLANFLYQHFKKETTAAKLHKYKSTIDYLVFDDYSSEKLLLSLYQATQENIIYRQKAKDIHKKIYKAKYGTKITEFDYYVPLVSVNNKYSIEEHKEMVLNAIKPMGEEYVKVVKKAFNENWIDFASYPGKMTGAYSIGITYGLDKKLILMNDHGDIRSTETLAHELGHSMHSYFSDQNQHSRNSDYKIFVAEIASIFNELLLYDYILANTENKKLKFQILQQMVEGFDGTVFRQTEWSNYEYNLYQAIEKGEPLTTYESLAKVYIDNAKKYRSDKVFKMTADEAFSAIRVPHFYYGFYVYKYAIGQLCAAIFFARYKKEGPSALQNYIKNFLSMGGKLNPIELLKFNGINLEDPKTYELGFSTFKNAINEWEKLAKEIYKNY